LNFKFLVLQGSAATLSKMWRHCGMGFVANFWENTTMKEF